MAAETNKDAGTIMPPPANGAANGAKPRSKRRSSLEMIAISNQLPSVERSLDEFIARANQTLNPETWKHAEHEAKAQDDARREADSLRWKAAEHQLREGEARETVLRRQLDGLQGRLAEAEARAAVASSSSSHDGVVADLKVRLTRADDKAAAAEAREREMTLELAAARASSASIPSFSSASSEDADARVRLAEAKAAKALAAARAAAAGLTVNPADLAAIESGLVVPIEPPRAGTNWYAVTAALVGGVACGLVIMFAVSRTSAKPSAPAPTPVAAVPDHAAAPAAAPAPHEPTVTPIVTPIEDPTPAPAQAAAPAPAPEAPVAAPVPAPVHHAAPPVHHAAPKAKPAAPKPASSAGIVDPF
ncbi:MAG TPA: hypothetical protein VGL61_21930 [Kofleriaceae bacterium]